MVSPEDVIGWSGGSAFATVPSSISAAAATNGQVWPLILHCGLFNHPINLTCDKGSLAALSKNIFASNLRHISPPSMERENARREKGGGEEMGGERRGRGMFNLLV